MEPPDEDALHRRFHGELARTIERLLLAEPRRLTGEELCSLPTVPEAACPVCMEARPCLRLPCAHTVCRACGEEWLCRRAATCPMCRAEVQAT
jgi:hypothetical protein